MAEQKSSTRRGGQTLVGIAAGLGIAAVLYAIAWFFSANMLTHEVERWLEARRAEGFNIKTGAIEKAGFPLRVAIRIRDLDLAAPPQKGRWTWQTPAVEVSASPLQLDRITLDLTGTHRVASPWLENPPLQFTAAKAGLTLTFNDGVLDDAQLDVSGGDGRWNGDASHLHVDKAGVRIALNPPAPPPAVPASGKGGGPLPAVTSRLTLMIENLTVPGKLPAPLSNTIREVSFNADVVGTMENGALPRMLTGWSNAGGAVNLKDFTLDWAPLAIRGEGSIALDQGLQPMGAFTTRLQGFTEGLDIMVQERRMGKQEAAVAKAMLGLMSKPGAGGAAEISLPLTVQDRLVSAGPLKLFEVPTVDWPQGAAP